MLLIPYLQEADQLAGEVSGSPGYCDVPDDVCQDTDQAHQQVYKQRRVFEFVKNGWIIKYLSSFILQLALFMLSINSQHKRKEY